MPAVAAEDDRPAIVAVEFVIDHLLRRGLGDLTFHRLPLAIFAFQFRRDRHRAREIGAGEHLHCLARMPHPPAGVEPRGEAESDVVAVERLPREVG